MRVAPAYQRVGGVDRAIRLVGIVGLAGCASQIAARCAIRARSFYNDALEVCFFAQLHTLSRVESPNLTLY